MQIDLEARIDFRSPSLSVSGDDSEGAEPRVPEARDNKVGGNISHCPILTSRSKGVLKSACISFVNDVDIVTVSVGEW